MGEPAAGINALPRSVIAIRRARGVVRIGTALEVAEALEVVEELVVSEAAVTVPVLGREPDQQCLTAVAFADELADIELPCLPKLGHAASSTCELCAQTATLVGPRVHSRWAISAPSVRAFCSAKKWRSSASCPSRDASSAPTLMKTRRLGA